MNIAFSPPDITELEINEVVNTLKSGWITTGPKVKLFESSISEYVNTSKTVCLSSATAAMELTLKLLGIREGDEVITSAYTYTATASVINHVGAKIVLLDTQKASYHMDYEMLEQVITEKTKVIISVDIGGVMCDYEKIYEIVEKKKHLFVASTSFQESFKRIIVVADAAHSFGAIYKGKRSGAVADFTCFSFHAVKNLTTAEGGAITWKDRSNIDNLSIYKQLMLLALHGQTKDAFSKTQAGGWEYDILYPAYKFNMTDIAAAMGLVQLQRYSGMLKRRREIIEIYNEAFENENIQVLKHFSKDFQSNGHLYMVSLLDKDEEYRNSVIIKMAQRGIATNVHFKPLPMLTAYKKLGFDIKVYQNSYDMFKNEVTLPLYTKLTNEQIEYISKNFKEVIREIS